MKGHLTATCLPAASRTKPLTILAISAQKTNELVLSCKKVQVRRRVDSMSLEICHRPGGT